MPEYLEREATVELLRNLGSRDYRREKGTIQEAIKMISFPEYTPAADVAPVRHGRWEKESSLKPKCSVCGEYHLYAWSDHRNCNYCPNCGARMDLHEGGTNDT